MIRGRTRFDGITLGSGTFSLLQGPLHLEAKAAFIDTQTGKTHGWTTHNTWSPGVFEKLKELQVLMEMDLARLHLDEGAEPDATRSVTPEEGGLGEFLSAVPQV